jgi:hypothetical protein
VWNRRTGNLVGGHQRLKVLLAQGQTEVEVSVVDLSPEKEKALNLALNKVEGRWEEAKLAALLDELVKLPDFDVSLTGFDPPEVEELLARLAAEALADREETFDLEAALADKAEPITRPGELLELGGHPGPQARPVRPLERRGRVHPGVSAGRVAVPRWPPVPAPLPGGVEFPRRPGGRRPALLDQPEPRRTVRHRRQAMRSASADERLRRARLLDARLIEIKLEIRRQWLALGETLGEIQQTLAYRDLGFRTFQQYVEDRLAISPRWANYLVCTVRKIKRFGVAPAAVAQLDISKSLEIFRLDDPARAKRLVEETVRENTPLRELKRQVAEALGRPPDAEPQLVRKVWYFSASQWSVIEQAIMTVQLATDSASETYAIELLAADYLAGVGLSAAHSEA